MSTPHNPPGRTESRTVNHAVVCKGITKSFQAGDTETKALRGIDLEVIPGELLMLVGPSGCGKTTLISIIAGILNQDGGNCSVYGKELSRLSEREKTVYRGKTIGFVFQSYNLIPTLTTQENVSVPLLLNGVEKHVALEKAADLLSRVGLNAKLNSYPTDLSGGQQQRVAISRALVHDPKLIVCDEPTSALDRETGHNVMEIFKEVALNHGRTLIVVTHDSRIFSFADRIARMNDGVVEEIVRSESELTVH